MTLEHLQEARILAMKNRDKVRSNVLSDMIDSVQKASITQSGRVEITEKLVNDTLIKYQKTIQEMIDTCPSNRTDKLDEYTANMTIVKEYAPQLITDESEISTLISTLVADNAITMTKENKGNIMRLVSMYLRGKVDMAVPLSPDELIKKRHAIYRHLSQKDIVPFPGDDSREFWQRAEERTQNTARLYNELGMAEYQAIEVFVKLF